MRGVEMYHASVRVRAVCAAFVRASVCVCACVRRVCVCVCVCVCTFGCLWYHYISPCSSVTRVQVSLETLP